MKTISPAAGRDAGARGGPAVGQVRSERPGGRYRRRQAVPVDGGDGFRLARNLASMAWLDDVDVQVTHNSVRVKARWRKPVALIDIPEDRTKIYVDDEPRRAGLHADAAPADCRDQGRGPEGRAPRPGRCSISRTSPPGVALAVLLNRMDAQVMPKNPLLDHIASIDVRNFKGRKNRAASRTSCFAPRTTRRSSGAQDRGVDQVAGGHGRAEARQTLRLLPGLRLAQRRREVHQPARSAGQDSAADRQVPELKAGQRRREILIAVGDPELLAEGLEPSQGLLAQFALEIRIAVTAEDPTRREPMLVDRAAVPSWYGHRPVAIGLELRTPSLAARYASSGGVTKSR